MVQQNIFYTFIHHKFIMQTCNLKIYFSHPTVLKIWYGFMCTSIHLYLKFHELCIILNHQFILSYILELKLFAD